MKKVFSVWIHDWNGDDPFTVTAYDAEEAAELVVERHDDEYTAVNNPIEVQVSEENSEELETFYVEGVTHITYRASRPYK